MSESTVAVQLRGEKAQKCTCERRSECERGSDAFGCAAFVAAFPIAQWHAHLTRTAAAAAAAGADVRSPPPPPSPHARTLSAGHLRPQIKEIADLPDRPMKITDDFGSHC
ncbi:hypothetical protein RB195_011960 [Necator americanus]|uniref:Phlebovirus glycoprotein G2 fusion domain-containing protein n=1 Tax=Necator americanus TaxID=51031 RepID=A0ABR1D4U2_NECAM